MPRGTQGEARRPVIQLAGLFAINSITGSFSLSAHYASGDCVSSLRSGPVGTPPPVLLVDRAFVSPVSSGQLARCITGMRPAIEARVACLPEVMRLHQRLVFPVTATDAAGATRRPRALPISLRRFTVSTRRAFSFAAAR